MVNKGVDRGTPFTNKELDILKKCGYTFVVRYLSKSEWKRLTIDEAKAISQAGLYNVVVYQDSNNGIQHFTFGKGYEHGLEAIRQATYLKIPNNMPIYFAIDFDVISPQDYDAIENYFLGVEKALYSSNYLIGVYGHYNVVNYICRLNKNVTHKWQTYAWSKGKVSDYNLYQYRNGVNLPENDFVKNVDLNLSNGYGGGWQI